MNKPLSLGTLVRRGDEYLLVTAAGPASPKDRKEFGVKTSYTLWSAGQNKNFTLLVGPRYSYFLSNKQ